MNKHEFLKIFANRDALLRSTTTISTLFTVSALALIPELGIKGMALAVTTQMFTSAFLEIPISIFSDKINRRQIVLFGLALKILVSLSFGLTIFAAWFNYKIILIACLILKSLLNSVSNSMLNGSFIVSYLNIYEQLDEKEIEQPLPSDINASSRFGKIKANDWSSQEPCDHKHRDQKHSDQGNSDQGNSDQKLNGQKLFGQKPSGQKHTGQYTASNYKQSKNPLFIDSLKHAMGIRLYYPLLFTFVMALIFTFLNSNKDGLYISAILFSTFIILARVFSFFLVKKDLSISPYLSTPSAWSTLQKSVKPHDSETISESNIKISANFISELQNLFKTISEHKMVFLGYVGCSFLNLFLSYFLAAKMYKALSLEYSTLHQFVWILTLFVGVVLYSARTILIYFFLPIFKKRFIHINIFGFYIAIFVAATICTLIGETSSALSIALIAFASSLFLHIFTDFYQRSIESNIQNIVTGQLKVTWVGLSNSMSYFLFGVILTVTSLLDKQQVKPEYPMAVGLTILGLLLVLFHLATFLEPNLRLSWLSGLSHSLRNLRFSRSSGFDFKKAKK